jgi:hypothetical protein
MTRASLHRGWLNNLDAHFAPCDGNCPATSDDPAEVSPVADDVLRTDPGQDERQARTYEPEAADRRGPPHHLKGSHD